MGYRELRFVGVGVSAIQIQIRSAFIGGGAQSQKAERFVIL